jgi:hypothetical protein
MKIMKGDDNSDIDYYSDARHIKHSTPSSGNDKIYLDFEDLCENNLKMQKQNEKLLEERVEQEVKIWARSKIKEELDRQVGVLISDIKNLNDKKEKIESQMLSTIEDLKNIKEEIIKEKKSIEIMLEQYMNEINKYRNMDL